MPIHSVYSEGSETSLLSLAFKVKEVLHPAWIRLDNFGCNTPEALASLLGAFNNNTTVTDLLGSDLTIVKIDWFNSASISNAPCAYGYYVKIKTLCVVFEYASGTASGKVFYTIYANNIWQRWRECTFTAI